MSSTIRNQAKLAVVALAALLLAAQNPVWAQGNKTGFAEDTDTTQGNTDKSNPNANPDNQGQTTTTTTGPKGQLDKDNTDCNNCDTEVDRPGANR